MDNTDNTKVRKMAANERVDHTFVEGDVFKTIIPLTAQATTQDDDEINKLLKFCKTPRTRIEMQKFMNLSNREHFRKKVLKPLVNGGLLKLTISDKPTSPKQKYYSIYKKL